MQTHRSLFVGLVAVALLAGSLDATGRGPTGPSVSGGGIYNVLDDTLGGSWSEAGSFAINAGLSPGGSPYGEVSLVGRGDFAAAWGACPYDPRCEDFPNTATFIFRLIGAVSDVRVSGDIVQLSGVLVETDTGKSDGVIFEAENEPFLITATEGSSEFVFQFCQVPPFTMNVAKGSLQVSASTPSASMLRRPVSRTATAETMPCHAPTPAG